MAKEKRILALIPARGGSKEVKDKNIRFVDNKPLIAWTIDAAVGSDMVDSIVLSSDSEAIIKTATQFGCHAFFLREASLAQDDTPMIDVVIDAIDRYPDFDWVLLLQPTSPLRTAHDIDQAISHCLALHAPACVSVCRSQKTPFWMHTMDSNFRLKSLLDNFNASRRQDLPPVYFLNGAIYFAEANWLRRTGSFVTTETVAYEMPLSRSLDIDTEEDFVRFKLLIKEKQYVSLP